MISLFSHQGWLKIGLRNNFGVLKGNSGVNSISNVISFDPDLNLISYFSSFFTSKTLKNQINRINA